VSERETVMAEAAYEASHHPERYPEVIFDETHFLITAANLERLPVYQWSKPTGVYHGKCWKFRVKRDGKPLDEGDWWVGCYVYDGDPRGMLTPYRKALVVEEPCHV